MEPLPDAPLVLTFKSARQADLAEASGARRLGCHRVAVEGGTFRERYERGRRASEAANGALGGGVVRGGPGAPEFIQDATALLTLPHPPERPRASYLEPAERALQAFLSLTATEDEDARALRALALHMLEGHAPGLFARWSLRPVLEEAVAALALLPAELPRELEPNRGMSRADACYVRQERGLEHPLPDPFFVLASQNPIELEGTYPLPEAQLDRFLFKLNVMGADVDTLDRIISTRRRGEPPEPDFVMSGEDLRRIFAAMDRVFLPKPVSRYISRLVAATHADSEEAIDEVRDYVGYGASPRAATSPTRRRPGCSPAPSSR